jgi:hypothetical protein
LQNLQQVPIFSHLNNNIARAIRGAGAGAAPRQRPAATGVTMSKFIKRVIEAYIQGAGSSHYPMMWIV